MSGLPPYRTMAFFVTLLACVAFALTVVGFVQAYTYDYSLASPGAPTATVFTGFVALALCVEVVVLALFTKPVTAAVTPRFRKAFYGACFICGFFWMCFYAGVRGSYTEDYAAVNGFVVWAASAAGWLTLHLKLKNAPTPDLKDTEKLKCRGCCGVGCCTKSGWGMCCRWTIFVFAVLLLVQSGMIMSESYAFVVNGQATNGQPLTFATVLSAPYSPSRPLKLNVYCSGPANSSYPTVLLEAGGGAGFGSMLSIMKALINNSTMPLRTCSYDRPGYGYSQAGTPDRVPAYSASTIDEALIDMGITGPVVCAGHSAGGSICRLLRYYRPSRVVGMVMLDAYCNLGKCNIERLWNTRNGLKDWYDVGYSARIALVDVMRFFAPPILIRLVINGGKTGVVAANYGGNICWHAQYWDFRPMSTANATRNRDDLYDLLWTTPNITGNIPLLVVGAGVNSTCEEAKVSPSNCPTYLNQTRVSREEIVTYSLTSPRGRYLFCEAKNGVPCTHGFVDDRAEDISQWIREVVLESVT